jgi:hypothetical protein
MGDLMRDRFNVVQFLAHGERECICQHVGPGEAAHAVHDYCHDKMAGNGTVERVIITNDAGTIIHYEWRYRKGVVFTP